MRFRLRVGVSSIILRKHKKEGSVILEFEGKSREGVQSFKHREQVKGGGVIESEKESSLIRRFLHVKCFPSE